MKIHGDVNVQSLFHSFRHGFKSFSRNPHWITSSGFQISLASSIISVAGLILALKDGRGRRSFNNLLLSWSSSENKSSSEKLCVVPGLQNLGNNCFLNVVLQALASCSCFLSSLQKVVEEFEDSSKYEEIGDMPLAVSLNTLLQELRMVEHEVRVLSPRKVMAAMAHYTPKFNLTSQQDAEEALSHMLSSLREECSQCFASNQNNNSLAAIATSLGSRILTLEGKRSDLQRWTQSFLGPFNGILGSILTCQSCSFQISLEFQFFNCLYLPPPTTYGGGSIIPGCTIEDCLKQFFVAERLENYSCTHCWHTAAMKYLSLLNKNEDDMEKVGRCRKQDKCECKNIASLASLPWSNNYSRTFKQLHISRPPKILCLTLQRASFNIFGESMKLQGHISFPLTLNISQFQKRGVEIKHSEQQLNHHCDFLRLPTGTYKQGLQSNLTEQPSSQVHDAGEIQEEEQTTHQDNTKMLTDFHTNGDDSTYNLVSVVEHFGSSGSGGHYTVYRRIINNNMKNPETESSSSSPYCWVGVSDTQVYTVSEEDVLGATGATLLFYQRVSET